MLNRLSSSRGALGYCFVEMPDEATAERCLRKINGKSMPGSSPVRAGYVITAPTQVRFLRLLVSSVVCCFFQPTRFKLNRATFGKQETG